VVRNQNQEVDQDQSQLHLNQKVQDIVLHIKLLKRNNITKKLKQNIFKKNIMILKLLLLWLRKVKVVLQKEEVRVTNQKEEVQVKVHKRNLLQLVVNQNQEADLSQRVLVNQKLLLVKVKLQKLVNLNPKVDQRVDQVQKEDQSQKVKRLLVVNQNQEVDQVQKEEDQSQEVEVCLKERKVVLTSQRVKVKVHQNQDLRVERAQKERKVMLKLMLQRHEKIS